MANVTTSDLIASGALILSLVALVWNIVRDLVVDRVRVVTDIRLGTHARVMGTGKGLFYSGTDIPKEASQLEILFTITNVGRRNVVIEKLNGDYKTKSDSRTGFFFTARELPKLLEPYSTHSEWSGDEQLIKEMTSGEVENVYAIDTAGKKWFVPKKKIERVRADFLAWKDKQQS